MSGQTHCHACGHPLPAADEEAPLSKLDRHLAAANSKQAAIDKLKQIHQVHGDTAELRRLIDELGLTPSDLKLPPVLSPDGPPTLRRTLGGRRRR